MFRVMNVATHLKLDSQLPESLTIYLAQHASLLLMVSPVKCEGPWTTGWEVYFQSEFNYNMLKRQGCLVYYREQKEERNKFGSHGSLAVLVGLNGFKMPDFTHKLHKPQNKQIVHRRDVLFAEDYLPYREGRQLLTNVKQDHWLRPGVGMSSRSRSREDEGSCRSLDGWDDGSLAVR